MTGVEVEGSNIPSAVPIEDVMPETQGAAGGAPEPIEVAVGEAAATTGGEGGDAVPEPALEVVVRSPEIHDVEPIRSVPMTGAATSSRGGTELLADDLVDPAMVAHHLEVVRQAEQWMKVSSQSFSVEYPVDMCCLLQDVVERSRQKSESNGEQLVKSQKHAAAMQSKLDTAFAQYHNDIQEMQAKSDDLVQKNKSLCNKNKGTRPPRRVLVDGSLR
jgi:hypothetical protein